MSKITKNHEEKTEILNDPRFSHLVSDPRFKQLPKHEKKVKIDKRFKSMFDDKKFKLKYTVDKYGRKLNTTSSEDLKKYYDIESSDEDDEEEQRKLEEKQITKDSGDEDDDGNDELETDGVTLSADIKDKIISSDIDYARGEGRLLSDSSSDDELTEEEDDEHFIEHVWGELDNDAPLTEESTRRLASCNMDWDRIRASDIMVLCNSFLPPGGSIISVKIYPSEFGKQRLAEEEINGPPELVENKKLAESDSEDDDLVKEQDSDAEEGDEYHMEKLRQYQLNRLKYYYAVIECDSVATADKLYKECDGLEYEKTATKLDFRFIPDDTSFDDDVPKDVCTELPNMSKYKPRLFTTTALQQAKVELTWDETSVERKELSEKLTSGSLAEVTEADLRKYVAYSSEEGSSSDEQEDEAELNDDEEEEKPKKDSISQYKSLLEEIKKKEDESKKSKFEMEYTWGINVSSSKVPDLKVEKKTLTPIERALEKKKEKNKRRKEERKKRSRNGEEKAHSSDDDDLPDGIDMNDPYFAEEFQNGDFEPAKKNSKNKQSKKHQDSKNSDEEAADEKNAKELELLIDEGDDDKEHFSLTKIQKSENQKKSKKSRKKLAKLNELNKSKEEDNFEVKLNDDRFGALYTSHLFNIDPTDPRFKKTKAMEAIIHEKIKRRSTQPEQVDREEPETKRPKRKVENSILIKNIKRKIQQL